MKFAARVRDLQNEEEARLEEESEGIFELKEDLYYSYTEVDPEKERSLTIWKWWWQ